MSGNNSGEPLSKKPEDSDFQQQRLKAWQPLLTPKWVIGTFILIGVIFIPIGVAILVSSAKVVELETRYDNLGASNTEPMSYPTACTVNGHLSPANCVGGAKVGTSPDSQGCTIKGIDYNRTYTADDSSVKAVRDCSIPINIQIQEDMDAPVYMYYKLSNFYQNHRRYVKSRSDTQLSGAGSPDTSTCDPWSSNVDGTPYYPCGLIAGSFFVDRFDVELKRNGATQFAGHWWNESAQFQKHGIAWKSDREDKFKVNEEFYNSNKFDHTGILGVVLPPVNDEDFIVWMRTAGLPTFKKLYRKIDFDLKKGDTLTVYALNYYPVDSFSGQKAIVFSTTSWLGGKNSFLGWAYVIVGIICFFLAIAFGIKHAVSPRPLGDMRAFNWPATGK